MTQENTSGQGANAAVPPEIDRWNWGAVLLNWVWGIQHNTYRAFFILVPFVGPFMLVALGLKGSAWAWKHKRWESVEQFKAVQRKWTKWGLIIMVTTLAAMAIGMLVLFSWLKDSEVVRKSVVAIEQSEVGKRQLGSPLEVGFPTGGFSTSGTQGNANLAFGVKGPQGAGRAYVEATQHFGEWRIDRLVLDLGASGQRVELVPPAGT